MSRAILSLRHSRSIGKSMQNQSHNEDELNFIF